MSATITIETRGVQGMTKIPQEFIQNILSVVGSRPLEEYADNVVQQMQLDAPVLTGYLRNNIRSWRENSTTVHATSWAPYSAIAEVRSSRPGFFQQNTFQSANIGALLIADASSNYLKILINKYQRMP